MADTNSRDKSTTGPSQHAANSRTAEAVTSQQQMEWEASNYKWDAYSMRVQEAPITGTPATAAVTSGRRSARVSAGVHMKQVLSRRNSRSKHSNEPLVCQVPGCHESLDTCKEYHQRYRICNTHAKADTVEIDSIAQRFCQQCGRFHGMEQFEGTKHSCRQQLSRHNALRRRGPAAAAAAVPPNHSSAGGVTAVAAATVGAAIVAGSSSGSLGHQAAAAALLPASGKGLVPVLIPVWPNMGVIGAARLEDLAALAAAQQKAAELAAEHHQQQQQQQQQEPGQQKKQAAPRRKLGKLQRVSPPKASSTDSNTQHMARCSAMQLASSSGMTGDVTTQQQAGPADAAAAAAAAAATGPSASSMLTAAAASGPVAAAPAAAAVDDVVGWSLQAEVHSTVQGGFGMDEDLSGLLELQPETQQQQQQHEVLFVVDPHVTSAHPSATALAGSPQAAAAAAADTAADTVMQECCCEQQLEQQVSQHQQQQVWQQQQQQVWQQPQQGQASQGLWHEPPTPPSQQQAQHQAQQQTQQQAQQPQQQQQVLQPQQQQSMNAGIAAHWGNNATHLAAAVSTAAVAPVAGTAAPNPDGSSEALLKELLDDLWVSQSGSADTTAQALVAQGTVAQAAAPKGLHAAAAAAAPTASTAAAAAALAPAAYIASDDSDPAATQALENIMQQLTSEQQFGLVTDPQQQQQQQQPQFPQHMHTQQQVNLQQQQQQQPHYSQPRHAQQQLQLQEQQQQQQVPPGLVPDPCLRQSSNSSCMSGPSNSSGSGNAAQPYVSMRQSQNSGSNAAAAADAVLYSYSGYDAACQVQPGYQLQSVPVPDQLFASIVTELGPLAPEQQQQQRSGSSGAAAAATAAAVSGAATLTPLLVQQAPLVQPMSIWQGGISSGGISPGLGLGYDTAPTTTTAAAAAAAAAAAGVSGHQQGNTSVIQSQQFGIEDASGSMAIGAFSQQQQQHHHHLQMCYNSLHQPVTDTAAAAAPSAAVGGSPAAWSNPLAGPLSASQRAAAAGHVRSMLLVAAAAGEASQAVVCRALQLMAQCGDWVPYTAMMQLHCLSMKILGAHPCALAADLREQLITAVVGATMPEAFLRPGCCLISLDYVITAVHEMSSNSSSSSGGESQSAAVDVVSRLCRNSSWYADQHMRVQLGSSIATWDPKQQQQPAGNAGAGSSSSSNSSSTTSAAMPSVCIVSSPAVLQHSWRQSWIALSCHGISSAEQLEISIRGGGQYYQTDPDSIIVEPFNEVPGGSSGSSSNWGAWLGARLGRSPGKAVRTSQAGPDGPDSQAVAEAADAVGGSVLVWFKLAEQPRPGALRVEVTCGGSGASGTAVLLVSDDAQLVAEISGTYDAPVAPATGTATAYLSSSSSSKKPALTAAEREKQLQSLLVEAGFVLELKSAFQYAYAHSARTASASTPPVAVAGCSTPSSSSSSSTCSDSSSSSTTTAFAGRQLHHYSSKEIALLVCTARRLVAAAVGAGCPATAAALLPVAGIGVSCADQLLDVLATEGLRRLGEELRGAGLLHMAVASQSVHMVCWLIRWGQAAHVDWMPHVTAAAGLLGLTPLHLAVLVHDTAEIAELLTDISPAAAAAWFGKVLSTIAPTAAAAAPAGSSSMSAGCSSSVAAAGQVWHDSHHTLEQQRSSTAAATHDMNSSSSSTEHPHAEIVLLPDDAMRCCGLTPAALAALLGRVVINAAIARKVPVARSCDLIQEAATEAADVAAGRSPAAKSDVPEGPIKPKPSSGIHRVGVHGCGASGDPSELGCPTCQLPLTSFNRAWHQHHDPAHLMPQQQQQQRVDIAQQLAQQQKWDNPASMISMPGERLRPFKGYSYSSARSGGGEDTSGQCMQGLQILQQQPQYGVKHNGACTEPQAIDGSEGGVMSLQVLLALVAGLLLLGLLGAAFVHWLDEV